MKRLFDLLLAIPSLVVLAPFMLVVALLILIDSRGPVLFKQRRVGQYNKEFWIYKFRTMVVEQPKNSSPLTLGNRDPRITRIGSFLRTTKIDELPQLFNVVKGDLSFVGFRPFVRDLFQEHAEEYLPILAIKPGITSLASLFFRNEGKILASQASPETYYHEVIMPLRIKLDRYYLYHHSFATDVRIILLTAYCIITGKEYRDVKCLREPKLADFLARNR